MADDQQFVFDVSEFPISSDSDSEQEQSPPIGGFDAPNSPPLGGFDSPVGDFHSPAGDQYVIHEDTGDFSTTEADMSPSSMGLSPSTTAFSASVNLAPSRAEVGQPVDIDTPAAKTSAIQPGLPGLGPASTSFDTSPGECVECEEEPVPVPVPVPVPGQFVTKGTRPIERPPPQTYPAEADLTSAAEQADDVFGDFMKGISRNPSLSATAPTPVPDPPVAKVKGGSETDAVVLASEPEGPAARRAVTGGAVDSHASNAIDAANHANVEDSVEVENSLAKAASIALPPSAPESQCATRRASVQDVPSSQGAIDVGGAASAARLATRVQTVQCASISSAVPLPAPSTTPVNIGALLLPLLQAVRGAGAGPSGRPYGLAGGPFRVALLAGGLELQGASSVRSSSQTIRMRRVGTSASVGLPGMNECIRGLSAAAGSSVGICGVLRGARSFGAVVAVPQRSTSVVVGGLGRFGLVAGHLKVTTAAIAEDVRALTGATASAKNPGFALHPVHPGGRISSYRPSASAHPPQPIGLHLSAPAWGPSWGCGRYLDTAIEYTAVASADDPPDAVGGVRVIGGRAPRPRAFHTACYVPAAKRIVVFGGVTLTVSADEVVDNAAGPVLLEALDACIDYLIPPPPPSNTHDSKMSASTFVPADLSDSPIYTTARAFDRHGGVEPDWQWKEVWSCECEPLSMTSTSSQFLQVPRHDVAEYLCSGCQVHPTRTHTSAEVPSTHQLAGPSPRMLHAAASDPSSPIMYVFGGVVHATGAVTSATPDGEGIPLTVAADLWGFNMVTCSWYGLRSDPTTPPYAQKTRTGPSPRAGHTIAVIGDAIVSVGGFTVTSLLDPTPEEVTATSPLVIPPSDAVWSFSLSQKVWRRVALPAGTGLVVSRALSSMSPDYAVAAQQHVVLVDKDKENFDRQIAAHRNPNESEAPLGPACHATLLLSPGVSGSLDRTNAAPCNAFRSLAEAFLRQGPLLCSESDGHAEPQVPAKHWLLLRELLISHSPAPASLLRLSTPVRILTTESPELPQPSVVPEQIKFDSMSDTQKKPKTKRLDEAQVKDLLTRIVDSHQQRQQHTKDRHEKAERDREAARKKAFKSLSKEEAAVISARLSVEDAATLRAKKEKLKLTLQTTHPERYGSATSIARRSVPPAVSHHQLEQSKTDTVGVLGSAQEKIGSEQEKQLVDRLYRPHNRPSTARAVASARATSVSVTSRRQKSHQLGHLASRVEPLGELFVENSECSTARLLAFLAGPILEPWYPQSFADFKLSPPIHDFESKQATLSWIAITSEGRVVVRSETGQLLSRHLTPGPSQLSTAALFPFSSRTERDLNNGILRVIHNAQPDSSDVLTERVLFPGWSINAANRSGHDTSIAVLSALALTVSSSDASQSPVISLFLIEIRDIPASIDSSNLLSPSRRFAPPRDQLHVAVSPVFQRKVGPPSNQNMLPRLIIPFGLRSRLHTEAVNAHGISFQDGASGRRPSTGAPLSVLRGRIDRRKQRILAAGGPRHRSASSDWKQSLHPIDSKRSATVNIAATVAAFITCVISVDGRLSAQTAPTSLLAPTSSADYVFHRNIRSKTAIGISRHLGQVAAAPALRLHMSSQHANKLAVLLRHAASDFSHAMCTASSITDWVNPCDPSGPSEDAILSVCCCAALQVVAIGTQSGTVRLYSLEPVGEEEPSLSARHIEDIPCGQAAITAVSCLCLERDRGASLESSQKGSPTRFSPTNSVKAQQSYSSSSRRVTTCKGSFVVGTCRGTLYSLRVQKDSVRERSASPNRADNSGPSGADLLVGSSNGVNGRFLYTYTLSKPLWRTAGAIHVLSTAPSAVYECLSARQSFDQDEEGGTPTGAIVAVGLSSFGAIKRSIASSFSLLEVTVPPGDDLDALPRLHVVQLGAIMLPPTTGGLAGIAALYWNPQKQNNTPNYITIMAVSLAGKVYKVSISRRRSARTDLLARQLGVVRLPPTMPPAEQLSIVSAPQNVYMEVASESAKHNTSLDLVVQRTPVSLDLSQATTRARRKASLGATSSPPSPASHSGVAALRSVFLYWNRVNNVLSEQYKVLAVLLPENLEKLSASQIGAGLSIGSVALYSGDNHDQRGLARSPSKLSISTAIRKASVASPKPLSMTSYNEALAMTTNQLAKNRDLLDASTVPVPIVLARVAWTALASCNRHPVSEILRYAAYVVQRVTCEYSVIPDGITASRIAAAPSREVPLSLQREASNLLNQWGLTGAEPPVESVAAALLEFPIASPVALIMSLIVDAKAVPLLFWRKIAMLWLRGGTSDSEEGAGWPGPAITLQNLFYPRKHEYIPDLPDSVLRLLCQAEVARLVSTVCHSDTIKRSNPLQCNFAEFLSYICSSCLPVEVEAFAREALALTADSAGLL